MYNTTGIKKNTLSPPGSVIGGLWWVIFPLCSPIHSYSIAAHNSYQTCFTTQRMTCFGTERNCNPMSTDWHQTLENRFCQPLAVALLSNSLTLEWSSSHLRLAYAINFMAKCFPLSLQVTKRFIASTPFWSLGGPKRSFLIFTICKFRTNF